MKNDKKIQEGIDAIERIKLLMDYSLAKTLKENLFEQTSPYKVTPTDYPTSSNTSYSQRKQIPTKKPMTPPSQWDNMVWDPNVTSNEYYLDKNGKARVKTIKTGGWVPISPENVGLRGVPFGFYPKEYPEYLKKVDQINKKYQPTGYAVTTTGSENENEIKRILELKKLKNEYYHPDFPMGISKENLTYYNQAKKRFEQEKSKEKLSSTLISPPSIPQDNLTVNQQRLIWDPKEKKWVYDDKSKLSPELSQIEKYQEIESKYNNLSDVLDALFEYDPNALNEINKNVIEKFWDEYGGIAEFVGWILATYLTEGFAAYLAESRASYQLAKIIKVAGEVGLPVLVGSIRTYNAKHLTEESIVDFMFAVLPWAHRYFGLNKVNPRSCENIISSMKNYNLKTADGMRKFVAKLSETEKELFRDVVKLKPQQIESGVIASIKDIDKKWINRIKKTDIKYKSVSGKNIKPSKLYNIDKTLGKIPEIALQFVADLSAIEIVKKLVSVFGWMADEESKKEIENKFYSLRSNTQEKYIAFANAASAIYENPKIDSDGVISSMIDKEFFKTFDDSQKFFSDYLLSQPQETVDALLVNEKGKKIDPKTGLPTK